ncbi:MAG: DUF2807 domain-containing protein [Actinobacteria bacterium]|nr:DUF2807 domain-containing protein [Actinomycetota bacterium]
MPMDRTSRIWLIGMMALVVSACGLTGSGDIVTEEREVGSFRGISICGGVDVELVVDPSAVQSVWVTYDDNLLDRVETRVESDVLVVELSGIVNVIGSGRFVSITMSEVDTIDAGGGSDLTAIGETDSYQLNAGGGSDTDLSGLRASLVEVSVSGGADARIFTSDSAIGQASGGSDITVFGSPAQLNISTSGGADVKSG